MYPSFKRIYTRSNPQREVFTAVVYAAAFAGVVAQWWFRLSH